MDLVSASTNARDGASGSPSRGRALALAIASVALTALALAWAPSALADQTITSSGPLTNIYLFDSLQCNATHTGDTDREFYGTDSCGTSLVVNGTNYGFLDTPYTFVSQTPVTGTGTAADPFKVVTVGDAGTTGLRITQTDSYIVGQEAYRTDIAVANSTTSAVTAALYHSADCYLQNSDFGYGFFDSATNSIFCSVNANNSPPDRIEGFIPLSAGASVYEARYDVVYDAVNGTQFPNSCQCAIRQDNGAGLSWSVTVPAQGSVTRSLLTSFSPAGLVPLSTTKTADSASSTTGSTNGYTITFSNPNPNAVTLDSITDTLPAGFTYVAGSSSGATTANPSVSGSDLTWSGPVSVPAAGAGGPGTTSLHFQVRVSGTPGTYTNSAGGTSADFIVIGTGATAPVEVTEAPFTLLLEPLSATNPVGTSHTVTATLSDPSGPRSGQTILFSASGANTATGSGSTNAGGQATFSYTGTNQGVDAITACHDADQSGGCDSGEATATASKDWTPGTTPPTDEDNPAAACRAERARIGEQAFARKYGTNDNLRNAFGKCVSQRAHARQGGAG